MTDRQKIINAIEKAKKQSEEYAQDCIIVPFKEADMILALLKEQEHVKPIFIENPYTHLPVSYCPQCREPIDQYIVGNPYKMTKFCHYCGKAVKWE